MREGISQELVTCAVYTEKLLFQNPFFAFGGHFCNENDVLEWIQGVTDGKILAIELFCGAKNRHGGEIYFSNVDNLKKDVCEYISASKECDNFKIRSYNGENDYDGYILNDEQRGTYIVINKI